MNKKSVCFLSLLSVGVLCFSTAEAAEKTAGMPNPMRPYKTVADAKTAAGFQPLYLPSLSGYHVNQVWVIAGDVIDIEYYSDSQKDAKFRLRTARCTELTNDNISGIHGATWKKENINGLPVFVTESTGKTDKAVSYAAHWSYNNMLFSVSGENLTYREFWRLLQNGLIELSQNYF